MYPPLSVYRCSITLTLVCLIALTACSTSSSSHKESPNPTASSVQKPVETPNDCSARTPLVESANGFPEVKAQASNGEVWALLFISPPPKSKETIKIVWRMTGTGDFHVVAQGPHQAQISPSWGPEEHGSSNWNHPGDEWGTGFAFSTPGCWLLHATRGNTSGDVWLLIH